MAAASAPQPIARRVNAPFWLALAVVVLAYVVAFYMLRLLIPQQEIAGTLAALSLGAGAYVQRYFESRLRTPRSPVVTARGYERPWWVLLILATAAIWLAQALIPYVQLRVGPTTAIVGSVDTFLQALPAAVALGSGVIIGQRSDRLGFAVTVAAVVIGWLLSLVTLNTVITAAVGAPPPEFGPPGAPPDPTSDIFGGGALAQILTGQLPLMTLAAMAGFWYGTRTRLSAYVGRLLRSVSPDDRDAVVALLYEEARTTASNATASPTTATTSAPPAEPAA
jgi:hypothetical protein